MKTDHGFGEDALALATLALTGALLAIGLADLRTDDPYIIYRVARNIASGQGFLYQPGAAGLVVTSPLYTLLMALMASLGLPLALTGHIGGWCALVAASASLYMAVRRYSGPLISLAGAMMLLLDPLAAFAVGLETPFLLCLSALALACHLWDRPRAAAICLGLAILTRADAALLAMALMAAWTYKRRRLPLAEAALILALVLPWAAYAWHTFGTPLPSTLHAKMAQGASGTWLASYLVSLTEEGLPLHQALGGAYMIVLAALALWGLIRTARHEASLIVVAWAVLHGGLYGALNVPATYYWYYAPLLVPLAWLATRGLESLLPATLPRLRAPATIALMLLAAGHLGANQPWLPPQLGRARVYQDAGAWLRGRMGPQQTVAAGEIGFLGFTCHCNIVDISGILSREVADHIRTRDFAWAIDHHRPDYLLIHTPPHGNEWFIDQEPYRSAYREVYRSEDERYPFSPILILQRDTKGLTAPPLRPSEN